MSVLFEREREGQGDSFIVNGVKERERGSLFISGSERLRHKTFCTTSVRETKIFTFTQRKREKQIHETDKREREMGFRVYCILRKE